MKLKFIWIAYVLPLVAVAMLSTGCDSSSGGETSSMAPAAISGNSALEIQNNSENEANIFFDNMFIGGVAATSTKTWSVPHGTHQVRITNAEKSHVVPLQAEYNFPSGGRVILELKFVPKTNTSQDYETKR
ncbi:MAG TPA: hypothetical protein PJ991_02645 [Kiritimatiellia bacterium]|nr:hypothetical protein [Kiritimatiellia bacterium]